MHCYCHVLRRSSFASHDLGSSLTASSFSVDEASMLGNWHTAQASSRPEAAGSLWTPGSRVHLPLFRAAAAYAVEHGVDMLLELKK